MFIGIQKFILTAQAIPIDIQFKMVKAKKIYRQTYNECAICGSQQNLETHHIRPVHINPELACDYKNFITLCDPQNNGCHRWKGHFGNFTSNWNDFIKEMALENRWFYINKGLPFMFRIPLLNPEDFWNRIPVEVLLLSPQ